jgi:hypothetical protein
MRPHFVFCSQAFRYCEDGFSPSLQLPNLTCIVAPVSDLLPRLVGEGIADQIQAAATLDPGLTSRVCCRQRHSWRLCRRILKAEAAFRWRWPPVTSRHLLSPGACCRRFSKPSSSRLSRYRRRSGSRHQCVCARAGVVNALARDPKDRTRPASKGVVNEASSAALVAPTGPSVVAGGMRFFGGYCLDVPLALAAAKELSTLCLSARQEPASRARSHRT